MVEQMTAERADEINAAMVAHTMFEMGLRPDPPPSLAGYTLQEMLEAGKIVAAEDDAKPCPKAVRTVCAERMVAALYTMTHYDPSDLEHINLLHHNGKVGIAVVRLPEGFGEDPDEETSEP
jgi:hypothetical protein